MTTVFPARFHSGWLGKIRIHLDPHSLKNIAAVLASTLTGGAFGVIVFLAALSNGDARTAVMLFPHMVAIMAAEILFLDRIFSLAQRDP